MWKGPTSNVRIREATVEDAPGIARVHVDTWNATYRGIVPDEILDGLSYEDRTQRRLEHLQNSPPSVFHLVAVNEDGTIVGFAAAGPERTGSHEYAGELYALYLLPSVQRRGIGRQLMSETARRLMQHGLHSMLVWVLAENPARSFYEALGGTLVREQMITIGVPLHEIGFGWEDISPLWETSGREPSL